MLIDLHTHSNASDGILPPNKLVQLAKKEGLAAIALTDHDTVKGIETALEAGYQHGIIVVPSVELSTEYNNYEIHILGYFIDYLDKEFLNYLEMFILSRNSRGREIVNKLNDLGILLEWGNIAEMFGNGSVGRPHIARALMDRGYVGSMDEAFYKYLNPGAPAFVPRLKSDPAEAVRMIKSAKGIPVLAHPGLLASSSLIRKLISFGIMGIEVYYPLHASEDIQYFKSICEKHNLVATGGSDYHGIGQDIKKRIGLSNVNFGVLEELKKLSESL